MIMTWNLLKLKLSTLQTKTVVSFDRIGLDKLENDYAYWQILTLVWPPKRPRDIAFIPSKRMQSWQISWIRHLHISHSAGLMCRPKFCVNVVFNFSRDGCNIQEKWKQRSCKILGGKWGALWEMCKWRIRGQTKTKQNIRGKKNARYIRILCRIVMQRWPELTDTE